MMFTANPKHLSLLLVSAALLAFQIALLQILAASQWHHFAYMVISIALLGFGVAGTVLSLFRSWFLGHLQNGLPIIISFCALSLAAGIGLIQAFVGGFDSYHLFVNPSESFRLAMTAILLMLPFFFGALAIGIIFSSETERIGGYYFANMLGSGVGCILGLAGLSVLSPQLVPPLCGLVCLAAAVLLARWQQLHVACSIIFTAILVVWFSIQPPQLPMSQYKDLSRALDLPGAEIIREQPTVYGKIQVVEADVMRSAAGLSLNWQKELPKTASVFVNGDMHGSLPSRPGPENPLNATTLALPFAIRDTQQVLVLSAGTGQNVTMALGHNAQNITAVEQNRDILKLLDSVSNEESRFQSLDSNVKWELISPRTWLARNTQRFDLIILPTTGSFGGGAGLFALQEQPLFTQESFQQAWQALSPNGMLSVTTWVDYPVRSPIRILATLVELLESNVDEPTRHIAAIRNWGTITFCIKKSHLTPQETRNIRVFANQWSFDPLLLPDIGTEERQRYNKLQDDTLLTLVDDLFDGARRSGLYDSYPFRVAPTSDNRPFFSQFLRWEHINTLREQFGHRNVPFIELGIIVAAVAAAILSFLAVILILLPLARLPVGKGARWQTFTYFGSLGLGYMWFELAMIHRFEMYLGQPVYSASLVIAVLLTGSAIGSAYSARLDDKYTTVSVRIVCATLAIYALLLTPILQSTLQLQLILRAIVAILLLLPAAFFMGIPFPLGLRRLNQIHSAIVPWAWGINGCLSVVGAAIATLIVIEIGYSFLLVLAATAYLLPSLKKITSQ